MSLPILQTGHTILRLPAKPVPVERIATPQFQALIAEMIDTMRKAPGVGLAAPQIGVSAQVMVLEDDEALHANQTDEALEERERTPFPVKVFINPQLTPIGDEKVTFFEGCLSLDGFTALVARYREVEVTGIDEHSVQQTWRVKGWAARILQHEVDHLNGTLYIDRMKSRSFASSAVAQAEFAGLSVSGVQALLKI